MYLDQGVCWELTTLYILYHEIASWLKVQSNLYFLSFYHPWWKSKIIDNFNIISHLTPKIFLTITHLERDLSFRRQQSKKLNTRRSTDTEIVAADDLMPQLCWTHYFLKNQGYDINYMVMYQDNQSAIPLENNGRASSSRRTKHLNIRYFS